MEINPSYHPQLLIVEGFDMHSTIIQHLALEQNLNFYANSNEVYV